jgi:transposase InsO family protein
MAFREAAVAWFKAHGVMTGYGPAYRSAVLARGAAAHGLQHESTRPDTARTNGKTECFKQTSIREWAHASPRGDRDARPRAIRARLHDYGTPRPHPALAGRHPLGRTNGNKVPGNDS